MEIIKPWIEVLTLIFLIVYVIKTWEMASATRRSAEIAEGTLKELRDTRDQETAPYVVVYFDVQMKTGVIYLVIENTGKTMASNIELEFIPPLPTGAGEYAVKLNEFMPENRITSLPPNFKLKTVINFMQDHLKAEYPLRFDVTVTYRGGINDELRGAHYFLDLTPYSGMVFADEYDIGDIAKKLEKIKSSIDKLAA